MTVAVARRSDASEAMIASGAKGRALMGGTEAMIAAGKKFLPQMPAEENDSYRSRLEQSWLFDAFEETVESMTGKVFDKPVEIVEGASQSIVDWSVNIDLQGNDLSQFAERVFSDALSGAGVSYIMVDAPRRESEVTQAQAESQNLRPYMVHLSVEEVLGWKSESINNVQTLTQIRILEKYTETDPNDEFSEETKEQIRVLDLIEGRVQVRIFRESASGADWGLYDEYLTDMSEIMVVPFYAHRAGFFIGKPPLKNLADSNVAHWRSQSDQRNILRAARVPMLVRIGVEHSPPITIGSEYAMDLPTGGDAKWIEHGGEAIEAGFKDLEKIEEKMQVYGLQMVVERTKTATGEARDSKKETSKLGMIADRFKDTLEQALAWMAELGGLPGEQPVVDVNKDYGISMMTPQEAGVLLSMVNSGQLSTEQMLEELKRRAFLSPDLVVSEELGRIEADEDDLMNDMESVDG